MSRTKQQMIAAKKLLKMPPGKLEPIDFSSNKNAPAGLTRLYMNNRYVVMINDNAAMTNDIIAILAMIQRHDDKPLVNHWAEMQKIKNELFGHETTAVEYYPAQSQLVNEANIYWLWILPANILPTAILS